MSRMIHFKVVTTDQDLVLIEEMAKIIWHEHYTPIIGAEQVAYMLEKFQSAAAMRSQIENGYQYFLIINRRKTRGMGRKCNSLTAKPSDACYNTCSI